MKEGRHVSEQEDPLMPGFVSDLEGRFTVVPVVIPVLGPASRL